MRDIQLHDVVRSGLPAALEKGARLLDPTCGVIKAIIPNTLEPGDPLIHAFGALTCRTERLNFNPMAHRMGGASVNPEAALAATIGEAVERYCAAYYEPEELVFATYKEVESDAVHPSSFGLFSERQYAKPSFPYKPLTTDSPITWTWGYSLRRQEGVHFRRRAILVRLGSDRCRRSSFREVPASRRPQVEILTGTRPETTAFRLVRDRLLAMTASRLAGEAMMESE